MKPTIRILAIIEATTVIGPAKNLLSFCRLVHSPEFCPDGTARVEVSIVTFERVAETGAESRPNEFVAAARAQGVTVDVIRERFRFDPRALTELREIVERRRPVIIQTHMIKSHFLVKASGLGKKYPWIAYHHGYTTTDLKMQFYNQLNRWSLPSADIVITVCGEFAKQLAAAGVQQDRLRVRHNSVLPPRDVSVAEKQALRQKYGIAKDEKAVLAVGRLSREKGHADLIESVALLRAAEPNLKFKLLIVGEGPEQTNLTRAITERQLESQIVFVGPVSDVAPFYASADLLALPSHSEGSPNVLLEAMAAGLPVVATSVGGVPEIATNEKDALLVPAREPNAFAEALRRALKDAELARILRDTAIARAQEFAPDSYARSLVKIYGELVSGPEAPVSEPADQGSHSGSPLGVVDATPSLTQLTGSQPPNHLIEKSAGAAEQVAIARGSDTMRVSVIIPLFNKALFIERALKSVTSQTFADFEVIVVDDGSTDGGVSIVESFADSRLRIIKQANDGPGAARNRGLREARGELVAFLDADDEWLPNFLVESVRLLDSHSEAAAVTSGYFVWPRGRSSESLWRSRGLSDVVACLEPDTNLHFVIALLAYMTPCTTVARKNVLQKFGGFYDRNRCLYGEDVHLWLKMVLNESIIINMNPMTRIHFEASSPTQTRRAMRPIEPFLIHPEEIQAWCPPNLRDLLARVLAARALKTACVLGYWGHWREARDLVKRLRVPGASRLPFYASSLVCRTPIGAATGKILRMTTSRFPAIKAG